MLAVVEEDGGDFSQCDDKMPETETGTETGDVLAYFKHWALVNPIMLCRNAGIAVCQLHLQCVKLCSEVSDENLNTINNHNSKNKGEMNPAENRFII